MNIANIILAVGGIQTGLLAGLLFDFSVAIVPGLRSLTAKQHIEAMQAINRKIQNLPFLVSFLGPVFLLPLAAFLFQNNPPFPLLVLAAVVYIVGVNGVTIVGNVPLNNELDKLIVNALSEAEAEHFRREYHGVNARWMVLHHIRTVAAVAATSLIFAAAFATSSSI